ncbi:MAG TPA: hypothetical protein VMV44_05890, partial [Rectinemataceae bacterium]|nr:hypothetical protein [Rectinemataceae bacterium]
MIAARNTLGEGRAAMVNETKVHPSIYSGNDDAEAFFDRMAEMFPAPDRLKKLEREVDSLT